MDHLLRPLVMVIGVWWLILYAMVGEWSVEALSHYGWRMLVVLAIAAPLGWVFSYLARHRVVVDEIAQRLRGTRSDLARSTIGRLPSFPVVKRAPLPKDDAWVPADLRQWWSWYSRKHPAHAAALAQAWQVMKAAPVPASPYPGGHGGATLIEHSWNVLRTLLDLKPWPAYKGLVTEEGRVVFDLLNDKREPYEFERTDPLPMLCAFAHDIGKVVCFVPKGDRIEVVKDDHDTDGARLVRALPAWRKLSFDDYQRAVVCVGWYHKPLQLPTAHWIDDRARALVMLINKVDILTGYREGEGLYEHCIARPALRPATDPASEQGQQLSADQPSGESDLAGQEEDDLLQRVQEAADPPARSAKIFEDDFDILPFADAPQKQEPKDNAEADRPHPEQHHGGAGRGAPIPSQANEFEDAQKRFAQALKVPSGSAAAASSSPEKAAGALDHISDEDILELTAGLLLKPGAVSGKKSENRVGYKYGSWLYLLDPLLNDQMRKYCESGANAMLPPSSCIRSRPGVASDFSKRLMTALANKGALKQEHDGQFYGKNSAFFFLASKTGSEQADGPYVIVCRAFAFGSSVFNLPDVPREPTIARAVRANQPLSDPGHIERIKQLTSAWREPKPAVEKKREEAGREASKVLERLKQAGADLAPFDRTMVGLLGPEEFAEGVKKDADGVACYKVEVMLRRFAPPQSGVETIDIDGHPYWRFVDPERDKPRRSGRGRIARTP